MNFYTNDLKNFIEKIQKEDPEAIRYLYKSFEGFIVKTYNDKIGIIYGNQYFEDYLSDVNLSIFRAASSFNGSTKNSFKRCMCTTIFHCEKRIFINKCKPQHTIKHLDDENDLHYIEKNFSHSENSTFNQAFFNDELMCYLKYKLNPLEIQLFENVYYKKETLKYFAETHNCNYSTIRSVFHRMGKKIKYNEVQSLLELGSSFLFFITCIAGW